MDGFLPLAEPILTVAKCHPTTGIVPTPSVQNARTGHLGTIIAGKKNGELRTFSEGRCLYFASRSLVTGDTEANSR
jgi:hypothetical protein